MKTSYDYLFGIVEILQRNLSKNKSLPEIYVYKMQIRLIENKQAVNDNNITYLNFSSV